MPGTIADLANELEAAALKAAAGAWDDKLIKELTDLAIQGAAQIRAHCEELNDLYENWEPKKPCTPEKST